MLRRSPLLAMVLALTVASSSCGVLGGGADDVRESAVEPVDLGLAPPTYAGARGKGLVLRSGGTRRALPEAKGLEWLPGGRALVYLSVPGRPFAARARLWDPATGDLGKPVTLWLDGEGVGNPVPAEAPVKRSVTQVSVTSERLVKGKRRPEIRDVLTAYDTELERRWSTFLPGPDTSDAYERRNFERDYQQGHTIDGTTFVPWSDFNAMGVESDPHYGLLRVGPGGKVIDQVQVNGRIGSLWLSADGASLLATRSDSDDPSAGSAAAELVELDPTTGEVAAEYGMPGDYEKGWDVAEVDKVGDRVAIRFTEYTEEVRGGREIGSDHLRGTWVLDDGDWSMLDGSEEEITWWQGPDDRIVARPLDPKQATRFRLFWAHGDEERLLPGRLTRHRGSVPGRALPPN